MGSIFQIIYNIPKLRQKVDLSSQTGRILLMDIYIDCFTNLSISQVRVGVSLDYIMSFESYEKDT